MKPYTVIRCKDCDQDITHKAQYYDREGIELVVRCENCNYRKGGKEWPELSPHTTSQKK